MGLTVVDQGLLGQYAQYTGFKNRIINGQMQIDQRNAGASVTANDGIFGVDRFQIKATQSSKGTIQQNAGSVTPPAGFAKYIGFTSSSAYSITSSDIFAIWQKIEGNNIADLAWGTANASAVTLSFKVYSSLTGTFGGSVFNRTGARSYPFTYTISSANTWTTISVTIAGDTSGTWDTDNNIGMYVVFGLGVGSTYSGTAGSWSGSLYYSATGATSVVNTSGATFYITGVQLEKGSTATSFDYRPYGTELALCQRYYEKSYDIEIAPGTNIGANGRSSVYVCGSTDGGGNQIAHVPFAVNKRSTPSMNYWRNDGTANVWDYNRLGSASTATVNTTQNGQRGFCAYLSLGVNYVSSNINGCWVASSEL